MKDFFAFLIGLLKPHRKTVLACSALAIGAALLDMVAPIMLGRSFDLANKHSSFVIYGGALLAWLIIGAVAERIRTYLSRKGSLVAMAASETNEVSLLNRLLKKPLSFHYGKQSQDVSRNIHNLGWNLSNTIQGVVFDFFPGILTIFAAFVYLLVIDWRIASILAVSVAVLVVYTYRVTPAQIALDEEWNQAGRKSSTFGWDSIRNILVVKSTTNENHVGERLDLSKTEFLDVVRRSGLMEKTVNDAQNLIVKIGTAAIFVFGLSNLAAGTFTLGRLTTVTAYAFLLFGYIRSTQWQFRSLLKTTAAWQEIQRLMDTPDEDFDSGEAIEISGDVEFKNVRFRYLEDQPLLEDVIFAVGAGEHVAIVGESGEGKTTLVDLLGRYYEPQSGNILYDGHTSADVNLTSLRSQMAYVPQDLTLFHESLEFNIRYGRPDATDAEVNEAIRLAHLEEFIATLTDKEKTVVGERGLKLSGGQRQRVALARAFLRNPKILVLDEPTSNLDSKTETFIQDSLAELMKGRTTFIIAHRLKTIATADRILVLKDGRIVEQGTHRELVQHEDGPYRALLKAQTFVSPDEPHIGTKTAA